MQNKENDWKEDNKSLPAFTINISWSWMKSCVHASLRAQIKRAGDHLRWPSCDMNVRVLHTPNKEKLWAYRTKKSVGPIYFEKTHMLFLFLLCKWRATLKSFLLHDLCKCFVNKNNIEFTKKNIILLGYFHPNLVAFT